MNEAINLIMSELESLSRQQQAAMDQLHKIQGAIKAYEHLLGKLTARPESLSTEGNGEQPVATGSTRI